MKKHVLFIQGGGQGAYDIDSKLAASLQRALGPTYEVHYPRMPNEDDPQYSTWKDQIAAELESIGTGPILVGHSVGGALLLRYMVEGPVEKRIAGLYLLAVPAWDDMDWNYDDLKLPEAAAVKLRKIPRIFFYQSRDDSVVPFAHLALHTARIPQAIVRESAGRGHQLGDDLSDVAEDITR
jgi:uncharacterized protein